MNTGKKFRDSSILNFILFFKNSELLDKLEQAKRIFISSVKQRLQ